MRRGFYIRGLGRVLGAQRIGGSPTQQMTSASRYFATGPSFRSNHRKTVETLNGPYDEQKIDDFKTR